MTFGFLPSKKLPSRVIFFIFALLGFTLIVTNMSPKVYADSSPSEERRKEYLNPKELLKTKAGQLFITRRYGQALQAFEDLAKDYPNDLIIKRYRGACLDHLKRDEEAITAFKQIIELNPSDLPSRQ